MVKKKAILAPLGVLAGLGIFAAIGYGLLHAGISSMNTWVDETSVRADAAFSGKAAAATGGATSASAQANATIASPASTAPQAGQIAAAANQQATVVTPTTTQPAAAEEEKPTEEELPKSYTTAEGYSGTVAPDHVRHDGEIWVSRTDSSGTPYYRTSIYLPYYSQDVDLADYGKNCYFIAQDGQPIYYDSEKSEWVLVEEYTPWVSPF